ncbi:hypothetical protein ACHAXA_008154 [Cyclostephanos tholiformis]|uniref:Pre-mRNA-splicing factor 38 n=1 Tax=Cyclostephanos tholiformis TaxID=382380 RepID=A0ABD3RSP9_9STRA
MANVTDPLARSVHGTNPQNLVEYITRQKIYDSLYWKEECFGLSASDVASKASELRAIGGSYGGNNRPTRFLCLTLKLLQIQPEDGIILSFIENEDFKYVRALGAFYLRLTGRPCEIYELLEPLYNDFRKLRYREMDRWKLTHVDELIDELLFSDRYCGIALPHLPRREILVNAGYLDGPGPARNSALTPLIEEKAGGNAEEFLRMLAEGNDAARVALEERKRRRRNEDEEEMKEEEEEERGKGGTERGGSGHSDYGRDYGNNGDYRDGEDRGDEDDANHSHRRSGEEGRRRAGKKSSGAGGGGGDDRKYGSLFKRSTTASDGGRRRDAPRDGGRRNDDGGNGNDDANNAGGGVLVTPSGEPLRD